MSSEANTFDVISVIGLGYIGLPTAALLASRGIKIYGVDTQESVVETISKGKVHIAEPDLDGLVQKVVSSGNLKVMLKAKPADAFIIAVPTPLTGNLKPDVTYVKAAARSIAPVLKKGDLVIIESTVPVGTTELVARTLAGIRKDLKFPQRGRDFTEVNIAHCPERVLPGRILTELIHNDRCIGGLTPACAQRACALYSTFVQGRCIETNARTAELVKLTENAFRDVNIAFANEMSLICDKLKIDVWELISIANLHPRVNILQPGPGVGGHCISVDPWFIVDSAPKQSRLIKMARDINLRKRDYVLKSVESAINGTKQRSVACLGLSFKPNVDDLRNSPALDIVQKLAEKHGDRIIAVEPYISRPPKCLQKTGARFMDALSALDESDVVVLLVDHRQFGMIDANQLKSKTIIDTKGLWRYAG